MEAQGFFPCRLRHIPVQQITTPLAPDEVYVGSGVPGSEYFITSQWCDTCADFSFFKESNCRQAVKLCDYLESRADTEEWLCPLVGNILVCTCDKSDCLAVQLVAASNQLMEAQRAQAGEDLQFHECFKEDPDSEFEVEWGDPEDVQQQALWAANETVSKEPSPVARSPTWPSSWHWLLAKMRAAQTLIFWDISAGCAELTKQFSAAGWETGPPIYF